MSVLFDVLIKDQLGLEAFILIDAFYLEIAWALRTCLEIPRRS